MRRAALPMRNRLSRALPGLLSTWGLLVLLAVGGFIVAYRYVGAPPPKLVKLATGTPDGTYYRFGQQYADILAEDGITLELVPTAGSVENLARLAAGDGARAGAPSAVRASAPPACRGARK